MIFSLSLSGKTVKKEPGNEDGQQHFDDTDKLLQEFQEAQVDRVGSRPSSNLSSLSNASERDQHHLGICSRTETPTHTLNLIIVMCLLTTHNTVSLSFWGDQWNDTPSLFWKMFMLSMKQWHQYDSMRTIFSVIHREPVTPGCRGPVWNGSWSLWVPAVSGARGLSQQLTTHTAALLPRC